MCQPDFNRSFNCHPIAITFKPTSIGELTQDELAFSVVRIHGIRFITFKKQDAKNTDD